MQSLTLRGFLSFGLEAPPVQLQRLNVLIGPNASGKSNLVEALAFLQATPKDLPVPVRQGGGVREWLHKGPSEAERARVELVSSPGWVAQGGATPSAIRYWIEFGAQGNSFVVLDERLENAAPKGGSDKPYFYFGYERGQPMLNVQQERRALRRENIDPTQSILSQRRDPDAYPELSSLAALLGKMRIYRNWQFGPNSELRQSCPADVPTDTLSESFENLPARLSALTTDHPGVKKRVLSLLRDLSPRFDDFAVRPDSGRLQLFLNEGDAPFSARRLSDGTLRYLCLLVILLDPCPPPLIVLEEPELGLHPDALLSIRDLLLEASERCELVVTTHSTTLVDGFTESPEAVVICEKLGGSSALHRLRAEDVDRWKEHGSLGTLWTSGEIGGTRW